MRRSSNEPWRVGQGGRTLNGRTVLGWVAYRGDGYVTDPVYRLRIDAEAEAQARNQEEREHAARR